MGEGSARIRWQEALGPWPGLCCPPLSALWNHLGACGMPLTKPLDAGPRNRSFSKAPQGMRSPMRSQDRAGSGQRPATGPGWRGLPLQRSCLLGAMPGLPGWGAESDTGREGGPTTPRAPEWGFLFAGQSVNPPGCPGQCPEAPLWSGPVLVSTGVHLTRTGF